MFTNAQIKLFKINQMRPITSEKTLESRFRDGCKIFKARAEKLIGVALNGWPDRTVFCEGGYVCFAEIKSTGEKPNRQQRAVHEELRRIGYDVYIIDDRESLTNALHRIEQRAKTYALQTA